MSGIPWYMRYPEERRPGISMIMPDDLDYELDDLPYHPDRFSYVPPQPYEGQVKQVKQVKQIGQKGQKRQKGEQFESRVLDLPPYKTLEQMAGPGDLPKPPASYKKWNDTVNRMRREAPYYGPNTPEPKLPPYPPEVESWKKRYDSALFRLGKKYEVTQTERERREARRDAGEPVPYGNSTEQYVRRPQRSELSRNRTSGPRPRPISRPTMAAAASAPAPAPVLSSPASAPTENKYKFAPIKFVPASTHSGLKGAEAKFAIIPAKTPSRARKPRPGPIALPTGKPKPKPKSVAKPKPKKAKAKAVAKPRKSRADKLAALAAAAMESSDQEGGGWMIVKSTNGPVRII